MPFPETDEIYRRNSRAKREVRVGREEKWKLLMACFGDIPQEVLNR